MPETDRDWVWDGGRPCIDFVNTLRARVRTPIDTIATPVALHAWLIEARLLKPDADADDLTAKAGALRDALDHLFDDTLSDRHVSIINACAAEQSPPALKPDRTVEVAEPAASVAGALALIAGDAIELVRQGLLPGVKVCGSDECSLRFLDGSPTRNRQWCSMRRCGNRAKARRHRQRKG